MTTKLVQDGKTIDYTATGDGTAGKLQVVGTLLCEIPVSFTTGDGVSLLTEGVFTCTKKAEANSGLTPGALAYYRVTGGEPQITAVAAGGTVAGTAYSTAVTGATSVIMKLKGHGPGV